MSTKAPEALISILSTRIRNGSQSDLDLSRLNWQELIKEAQELKVLPLLSHALEWADITLPNSIQADLKSMRTECFGHNMAHIAAAVRLCRNFHTHGIDVVCIKGSARAFEVYGEWDMRFTHDIDLLVRARDYREAAKVLTSSGYSAPISESDNWWHNYLGESPYLPISATGSTVDLHYKLHQPGTPAIGHLEPPIDRRVMTDLGNFTLPMLSKHDAMMLTATSFGKAVRARQPWLSYAHEIAYARANDPEMSDLSLDAYAKKHGISRLWGHAKTAADSVFGNPADGGAAPQPLKPDPEFLYRSKLLWKWSEGTLTRPINFAQEFAWVTLAEVQHDRFASRRRKS